MPLEVGLAGKINWAVLWYIPEKDTIRRVDCGSDLDEAIRLFTLAERAGKDKATLMSVNFGFPPPEKFRPHVEMYIEVETKTVLRKGKRRKKKTEVKKWREVNLMEKANAKGIFWCPYCRTFRKFQRQLRYLYAGRMRRDPRKTGGLYCPMCGISHRDMHVRRWNPVAKRLYSEDNTRRKTRASRPTRSRARRSRSAS